MEEMFEVNSKVLLAEIRKALESISYGSLEIFVQDGMVTQLTVRTIHKTKLALQKKPTGINGEHKLVIKKINTQ